MSFGLFTLRPSAALSLVLVLGAVTPWSSHAQEPPKRVPASEARTAIRQRNSQMLTNVSKFSQPKDPLRELQDELNRSYRNFTPSSLDGIGAPPFRPTPVLPNPKLKELQERRKNWALSTPEEILNIPTIENVLNPEAQSKTKGRTPSLDDYLKGELEGATTVRKFGGSMEGVAASLDPSKKTTDSMTYEERDSKLSVGLRGSEAELRKLLVNSDSPTSFSDTPQRGSFSDFFGLGDRVNPKEVEAAHKAYLKEYQGILQMRGPAPNTFANQFVPTPPVESISQTPGYRSLDSLPSSSVRKPSDAQLGVISPSFNPSPVADLNAKVINSWNPMQTAPVAAPAAPKPRPMPTFQVPKRSF
jgi:hypothetical protein